MSCEEDTCSKPIKATNGESQGGCARCVRASQSYETLQCKECITTATGDNKFSNFKRAPDAAYPKPKN